MRLDGSAVTDWQHTGVHPRYGVRLESASLASHVYVPAHMIAATDVHARRPEAARSESERDLPPAPLRATIAPGVETPPPPPPAPGAPTLFDQPAARWTDPDTSREAAATATGLAAARRRSVLLAHAAAGDSGLTGEELAAACREDYAVVGPRRPSLERAGLVEYAGYRRPNSKGNPERVYRCTPAGRAEAARLTEVAA